MYLETAHLLQLSGALLVAVLIFIAANATPLRVSVGVLLILIPFQPVATSYGSANVVMTYVLAGALMVRGRLRYAPMLGSVLLVLFAYLITISQLPRSLYVLHGIEFIALISGFLMFILAYNIAREEKSPKRIIDLLIWSNALSIVYCFIQLTAGPGESIELFGIRELSMNKNRGGGDARLVGPFDAPGITAAYFMCMTLILIYEAVNSQRRRKVLVVVLALLNVVMILATANRGSFLVLLASTLGFLYIYRERLGFRRIVQILVAATVVLVATATLLASYTDFGQMFGRLAQTTETVDGMPATRVVAWPLAFENIRRKPLTGHGPRIVSQKELRFRHVPPEQLVGPYPHNLYLHLLVTVGILGTVCMLFFFFGVVWRVYQSAKRGIFASEYERGWILVGIIVMVAFFVDELKIEFLRAAAVDYAHFVFAIFGIFLGWADKARQRIANPAA